MKCFLINDRQQILLGSWN